MKSNLKIHDINDLHAEISRLKALSNEQEAYLSSQYGLLKHKVQQPMKFINNVVSFLPGSSLITGLFNTGSLGSLGSLGTNVKEKDWITRSAKIGALAVIDRLFLRKAGLFKRLLIGVLSQQAVEKIDKDTALDLIQKVTDWIRPTKKKESVSESIPQEDAALYGIPPDSESY